MRIPVTGSPLPAKSPGKTSATKEVALPPDILDLFGVFATAGSALTSAASALYAAHKRAEAPPPQTLASVRTAAVRVLSTLADYDDAGPGET